MTNGSQKPSPVLKGESKSGKEKNAIVDYESLECITLAKHPK